MNRNNSSYEMYYSFQMDHLPQKFQKKAELELFETPESKIIRTEELRKLIRSEESMKEEWFTDEVILMYLRSRKFDAHKAFYSMKKMVAFIKKNKEYFDPINPEVIDEILKVCLIGLLPRRDSEGHAIFVFRMSAWDLSKITMKDLTQTGTLLALNALSEPMTQINGGKLIMDFKCSSFRYIRYITPFIGLFWYQFLFECIPLRAKGAHIMNPSVITKILMSVMKSMLPEKLKSRIFYHDDPREILTHLPRIIIPKEYGGTLPKEEDARKTLVKTLAWPDYVTAILEHFNNTE